MDVLTVSIDVAEPPAAIETFAGLTATVVVLAIAGSIVAVSETVPAKLSRLFTVIVSVADKLSVTLRGCGLLDRLKSGWALPESLHAVRA